MSVGELKIYEGMEQGSEEWHALRRWADITASEVPAMMGCDPRTTRNDLLSRRKYGIQQDVSDYAQRFLFDRGHELEDDARLLLEIASGNDYPPAVGVREIDGVTILASLDGRDAEAGTIWEHKTWNQQLAEDTGNASLPPEKYWQLEAQLLVFGDEIALFTVSDGTEDNIVTTEYRPVPGRAEELIAAAKQFKADIAEHQAPAPDEMPEGVPPKQLPALVVDLRSEITQSNVDDFRMQALIVLDSISADLATDQDFADAELAIKYCAEKEADITLGLKRMEQGDIQELRAQVEEIREMFRRKRINLEKLVKSRKVAIRSSMIDLARDKLANYVSDLNRAIGRPYMPDLWQIRKADSAAVDFAAAQKGTKTQATAQAKVDQELADAKIAATKIYERIHWNLKVFLEGFGDRESLFPDLKALVLKDPDDFANEIQARIHRAEAERVERENLAPAPAAPEPGSQRIPGTTPTAVEIPEKSPFDAENPPPDDVIVSTVAQAFGVEQDVATGWLIAFVLRIRPPEIAVPPAPEEKWPQERDGLLYNKHGVPWIEEAHSANKTCTADGNWRAKRGVGKSRITELEAPYLDVEKPEARQDVPPPVPGEDFMLEESETPTDEQAENATAILDDIGAAENEGVLAQIEDYAKSADLTSEARNRVAAAIETKRAEL